MIIHSEKAQTLEENYQDCTYHLRGITKRFSTLAGSSLLKDCSFKTVTFLPLNR
ncbi:hypothetical protein [Aliikangiella coralliicola]|uniref:hypothetical protein n=1 Tax=Aliikangiella coralliicola TaxID=2592383 RepID=UPI00143D94F3|nr:hypothetical protein [Aliikangiella coralliicola]